MGSLDEAPGGSLDENQAETPAGAQAKVDTHTEDSSAAHAASAISFTPAGTIAATNVQTAIEEAADEAARRHDYTATPVEFANTTAEQTYYSKAIAPADLDVGAAYRLSAFGTFLNNSGGAVTLAPKLKFGATSVLDAATPLSITSAGAETRKWFMEVLLFVTGATAQRAVGFLNIGPRSADSWSGGTGLFTFTGVGTAAEDIATAKTLALTMTMGTAHADTRFALQGAILERI